MWDVMRKTLVSVAMLGCVLATSEAHAQFANKSLGVSPAFFKIFANDINWAIPLTIDGSFYIENGFDVFAHIPVAIFSTVYADPNTGTVNPSFLVFGTGAQLGVRYLFMEETIRPYLGLQASIMFVFTNPTTFFGGPGIVGGLDIFLSDTVSLGPRAFFDLFLELNRPVRYQVGGAVSISVYF